LVKSGWEWVSDYKQDNVRNDEVDPQGPPRNRAANHSSGPLRRMEGGEYHGDTHLNLHGAIDENGNGEEGIAIFRLVVEVGP
jgi:DNA-nicking Smr family endonuclease